MSMLTGKESEGARKNGGHFNSPCVHGVGKLGNWPAGSRDQQTRLRKLHLREKAKTNTRRVLTAFLPGQSELPGPPCASGQAPPGAPERPQAQKGQGPKTAAWKAPECPLLHDRHKESNQALGGFIDKAFQVPAAKHFTERKYIEASKNFLDTSMAVPKHAKRPLDPCTHIPQKTIMELRIQTPSGLPTSQ